MTSDHEAGAYALTKWLIGQGRKRILRFWQVAVGGPSEVQPWLTKLNAGYERAMRECGVSRASRGNFDPANTTLTIAREDFELQSRLMAGYLVEHLRGPNAIDKSWRRVTPLSAIFALRCGCMEGSQIATFSWSDTTTCGMTWKPGNGSRWALLPRWTRRISRSAPS